MNNDPLNYQHPDIPNHDSNHSSVVEGGVYGGSHSSHHGGSILRKMFRGIFKLRVLANIGLVLVIGGIIIGVSGQINQWDIESKALLAKVNEEDPDVTVDPTVQGYIVEGSTQSDGQAGGQTGTGSTVNVGGQIIEVADVIIKRTCNEGYTQIDTNCTKKTSKTVEAKAHVCPSGFDKSGEGEGADIKCSQNVGGTKTSVAVTKTYKCLDGWDKSGDGEGTKCNKSGECPAEYTKNGSVCQKPYAAADSPTYTCNGVSGQASSTCLTYNSNNFRYSCSSGSLNGGFCTKGQSPYLTLPSCLPGYTGSSNDGKYITCTKSVSLFAGCPYGYASSTKKTTVTCSKTFGQITKYHCVSPWLTIGSSSGSSCQLAATPYCLNPTVYKVSGNTCVKTESVASTLKHNYSCSGKPSSSSTCIATTNATSTTEIKPIVTESCPNGDPQVGDQCVHTNGGTIKTIDPIVESKCPERFKSIGDNKCLQETVETKAANVVYSCEKKDWLVRRSGVKVDCVLTKTV